MTAKLMAETPNAARKLALFTYRLLDDARPTHSPKQASCPNATASLHVKTAPRVHPTLYFLRSGENFGVRKDPHGEGVCHLSEHGSNAGRALVRRAISLVTKNAYYT
jgi:hypothetical protein